MTALRSHCFKARLKTKTTTMYESLINEDYHTMLIEREKITVLKIERSFCKSTWLAIFSSRAVRSDRRKRQTLHRVFNTFVSKTVSANFDIFLDLFFYARLNFEVRKNIPPIPSFVYNSRKSRKNQKRRHGF